MGDFDHTTEEFEPKPPTPRARRKNWNLYKCRVCGWVTHAIATGGGATAATREKAMALREGIEAECMIIAIVTNIKVTDK